MVAQSSPVGIVAVESLRQIGKGFARQPGSAAEIENGERVCRRGDHEVRGAPAEAIGALAMFAAVSPPMPLMGKMGEVRQPLDGARRALVTHFPVHDFFSLTR